MPRLRMLPVAAAAVTVLASGLASGGAALRADAPTGAAIGSGEDWIGVNADSHETGFSRLSQIDPKTIGRLRLAWSMDLPGEATLEASPIEVDGTLYFTGSYAGVYAIDAASGALKWKYDPKTWEAFPAKMAFGFAANRGVAYDDGKIFVGARGYVTVYDQATGKQAWRFYVVPGSPEANVGDPAMEAAAKTWNGEFWKDTGGGGAPWDSMTFDAELGRIYVGTANAAPYDPEQRSPGGGDNLYTASIVALDANTGKYLWHYQVNPRDSWDYDCTQQMTLATLMIDGRPRKVLMQAPKNGFFYVLDRDTVALGKALSLSCAACHGRNLVSAGGPAPDLRESPIPLDAAAFRSVVHDGALMERGMPRFDSFTTKQMEGLRQYVRARAALAGKAR